MSLFKIPYFWDMKIGYLTKQDPENKKAYSGTHYYMYRSLQRAFDEVIPLGPVDSAYKFVPKLTGKVRSLISGKTYKYQYDRGLAKRMAAAIDKKIIETNPDVIFASLMSPETAYLKTEKPVYLTSDATFPLLHDLYKSHSNLHPKSIKNARYLEQKAFEKATKLIFPLQWLADSAMKEYGIPARKIEVVPYGANLERTLTADEFEEVQSARMTSNTIIKLIFVGVRWEEKGGPFAVQVFRELQKKEIPSELWILGCKPEIPDKPEQVKIVGFLDKSVPKEQEELFRLYREASFFIMPTKAECVGMSFIEAASFGLPAIGTETGGVPEAVIHDQTGFIIKPKDSPKNVADWIAYSWFDKKKYEALAEKAYQRYQNQMNWNRWGEALKQIVK
ncbi:glycosyltransferase family 4 protein [Gracilimonas tropica]|uniref:glycosyltransferase family 4 protein n=1 Tax=Gracilimonas tropica TaxID=454600 RepID=UPI0003A4FFEE|nr:glycosyltransferase family 4 protein [Gracilimonas tropica]